MAKVNLVKLGLLIFILSPLTANAAEKKLIYSVYWNGCENVCKGIKDYFATKPLDVEVLVREYVRDKEAFPILVQEAKDLGADVVVTRGTSVTLGMVGQTNAPLKEKYLQQTPVVFTLVSDPIQSKIIDTYDVTGRSNITGVRNRVPEAINIATIKNISPSFKRHSDGIELRRAEHVGERLTQIRRAGQQLRDQDGNQTHRQSRQTYLFRL